jgi:hypothetical protein
MKPERSEWVMQVSQVFPGVYLWGTIETVNEADRRMRSVVEEECNPSKNSP